jgi:hypothetical protein
MAKRFTDTDKWKRPWFRTLPNDLKVVWFYLLDQCDHAGVWCADFELMRFQTGVHFDAETLEQAFDGKIKRIEDDKYFIPSFVEFQYGELTPTNNTHRSVLKIIQKIEENEPLRSPSRGDQDKGTDKDKGKKQKTTKPKTGYPPDFDAVYDAYPRKEGKSRAYKIYAREIKTDEDRDRLLAAVQNYAERKVGTEAQYLKHFSTFMGEWKDWLDANTGTAQMKPTINVTPIDLGAP